MASLSPVSLSNTEQFNIRSSYVSQEFSIFIGLPPHYDRSNRTYPALYILDGNLEFPLVKSVCEFLWLGREIVDTILVGIGYDVQDPNETVALRTRDLTPTTNGLGTGGARNFLQFIERELIPRVDLNYGGEPDRRALFGDSRAGLFALYVLFSTPGLFRGYIIGSPSIWWDDRAIFRLEELFAAQYSDLPAHVFVSAGSMENRSMVANMGELMARLLTRNYPNLTFDVNIFEGETHYSVIPATVSRGLKSALGAA